MKKITIQTSTFILGVIVLASCSSNKMAMNSGQDNLYFMASDAKVSTEFAVKNNNPEQFESFSSLQPEAIPQGNFSSRNVNPDYIARYQTETAEGDEGVVYFDEGITPENQTAQGDINAYNNFRVNGNGSNNVMNPSMAFNMGMGMMNPWGMRGMGMMGMGGMGMMDPWGMGMGGFYDPFFNPGFGFNRGFGFRPGFNMGFGMGFGGFNSFGMGFGGFGGFGGFNSFGMGFGGFNPFFGNGLGMGFGNPFFGGFGGQQIIILPGSEYGQRREVTGARPSRGSSLSTRGYAPSSNAAIQPSTARAEARRSDLNNGSSRSATNSTNARTSSRDFGTSQNDYYSNSRSRVATNESNRNVGSPALDRSVTRSRSAMPSARPSASPSNSRNYTGPSRSDISRSSNPSYNNSRSANPSYNNSRSGSPSYNRSTSPGRPGNPSYNSGGTNSRSYGTPSRSSSPSYSAPSRSSSGGGMSSGGGASRSSGGGGASSGGSRGGRGN
jgi:hypothetical protein